MGYLLLMKNMIVIIILLVPKLLFGQLPYTWTSGVNPFWVSTNMGSGNALNWQSGCGVVTTNCSGNYSNNQDTYYTSNTIDASCGVNININFTVSGNAEIGYDFLFVYYSLNNGITWINPYGANSGWTGNFGGGVTIPTISVPSSSTFKFRFEFYSDNSNKSIGYKISAFNMWCSSPLPIELLYFNGKKNGDNIMLEWSSATEYNNDYYTIEKSNDGISFFELNKVYGFGNSTIIKYYNYLDIHPYNGINYYRLSQTDFNGKITMFKIIGIEYDNNSSRKLIKVTNILGQDVSEVDDCIKIYYFSDGSIEKRYKKLK